MRRRLVVPVVALGVLVAGGGGGYAADALPWQASVAVGETPPLRVADVPATPVPASSSPPVPTRSSPPVPTRSSLPPRAARPSPPAARLPTAAGLARVLGPLLDARALGPAVGAAVVDPVDGRLLFARAAGTPRTPASLAKLATATAALRTLGATTTLRTTVVAGPRPGQVVLVGGGDPSLTAAAPGRARGPRPASLPALADATAAALRARGVTRVSVGVDDSLFTGPRVLAEWPEGYVEAGVVAPVSALALDRGASRRARAHELLPRSADPALAAGRRFAVLLAAEGIRVSGQGVRRVAAREGAPTLAAVVSPPVRTLVEETLRASDNDAAEALARHVALAEGRPGTFAGGAAGVRAALARLGVPLEGVRLPDGSGLARAARMPPAGVAALVAAAHAPAHPELRPVLAGLPVAGRTGTLADRFRARGTASGVGRVRAKTGTLTGVISLAGDVRDADGRVLVFALLADRVPRGGTTAARTALDRAAAALARCGCR